MQPDLIRTLLADTPPAVGIAALKRQRAARAASRGLAYFVRAAWPLVESRPLVWNWHLDALCDHLEAVSKGEVRALIAMFPPRHSKSLVTTVFWPAWTWLARRPDMPLSGPRTSFAFASWSSALSTDHNLALKRLVSTSWYREAAGETFAIDPQVDRADDFRLVSGGRAFATSVNSTVMGFGFDIRVADDPNNLQTIDSPADRYAVHRWYDEVWKSRVEDPKRSAEVIIMQRGHREDLVGHLLASARAAEFTLLCLPAEYDLEHPHRWSGDPRTEPGELLDKERFGATGYGTINPATAYAKAAQMQQNPTQRGAGIFRNARWQFADDWPAGMSLVRWWDRAATPEGGAQDPDYTSGALGGRDRNGLFWLLDIQRGRWSPHQVDERMQLTARELDPPGTAIYIEEEPGAAGKHVISYIQRHILPQFAVRGDRPTGPKLVRIDPLLAAAEAGNVVLVRGGWNRAFLDECDQFTGDDTVHDDQVISVAGAFNRSSEFAGGMIQQARLHGV